MATGRRQQGSLERKMLRLRDEYLRVHPDADCIEPRKVADWAISEGKYRRRPPSMHIMFKRELTRAMRNEYYEDAQGREVRLNHPVPGDQGWLWVNLRTARPEQMRVSFAVKRRGILADCLRCSIDFDSYNDNNLYGVKLGQMDFNFTPDVDESRQPDKYPDKRPE
jgi:hypothetical protein